MINTKVLIVASIITVILGGATLFLLSSGDDPLAQINKTSATTANKPQTVASTEQSNGETKDFIVPGYVEYDAQRVIATGGDKVIFFHANWCPICEALQSNILEEGVPEGLTIFKANFDTDTDLRKQYGVTAVSSLVQVDDSGTLLKKWAGSLTIQQVVDELI